MRRNAYVYLERFLVRQQERDRPLPPFIEREFRSLLDCGLLERGFLRLRCESLPFTLRYRLAYDSRLTSDVLTGALHIKSGLARNSPPQLRRGGAKRRGGDDQTNDFIDQHHPSLGCASALPSSAEEGSLLD